MMTSSELAARAPTQQELTDAVARAHLLRSQAFRNSARAIAAFFKGVIASRGVDLGHAVSR